MMKVTTPNIIHKGRIIMSVARLSSRNHPLFQLFSLVDQLCTRFEETSPRRGRPRRFSDAQIIKCMVYQLYYRIRSFRELEWKLKLDFWALRSIGITEVPDHSTFCRRVKQIEEDLYGDLYDQIIDELQPKTRVCFFGIQQRFDLLDTIRTLKRARELDLNGFMDISFMRLYLKTYFRFHGM